MKNRKRLLAMGLAAIMMVATITACGGESATAETPAETTVENEAPAEEETSAEAEATEEVSEEQASEVVTPAEEEASADQGTPEAENAAEKETQAETATETEDPADEESEAQTGSEAAETAAAESQYGMTEDDAMYFTFEDGKLYRLTCSGDFCVYEEMQDLDTVNRRMRRHIHKDMVNYIVEKYFCSAIAKEEGVSAKEVEQVNKEEFIGSETNPDYFHWGIHDCKLTFVRNGTTWVMYYEEDCLKVGKLNGENVTEIMAFAEEDAREETELFVDMSFINSRLYDYEDTEFHDKVIPLFIG